MSRTTKATASRIICSIRRRTDVTGVLCMGCVYCKGLIISCYYWSVIRSKPLFLWLWLGNIYDRWLGSDMMRFFISSVDKIKMVHKSLPKLFLGPFWTQLEILNFFRYQKWEQMIRPQVNISYIARRKWLSVFLIVWSCHATSLNFLWHCTFAMIWFWMIFCSIREL